MRTRHHQFTATVIFFIGLAMLVSGCASKSDVQPPPSPAPSSRLSAIQSVTTTETENSVQVAISADGPITYSALKQPDPPAVVLYFPQTSVSALPPVEAVDKGPVSNISVRNGQGNQTARMEIGLRSDAAYKARQDGAKIVLEFEKSSSLPSQAARTASMTAAAGNQAPTVTNVSMAASPAPETAKPSSDPIATGGPTSNQPNWVNKVDFFSEAQGKSTLMVGTRYPVAYQILKPNPRRIEVHLANTQIPDYHQRPLITTRFDSAVDRILPIQPDQTKEESIVVIDLREAVPFSAEQSDNILMIHFQASSVPPKPMEQAALPAWKQSMLSEMPTAGAPMTQDIGMGSPMAEPLGPMTPEEREAEELNALLNRGQKTFSGEKIALDFYETDIKNVFRIIREISGKNFAIDKNVTGKVTMTLDKPVPWDQVLDLVLRMNQLGMAQEGDIIRIATLDTLKKEDDLRKAKLEALKKAREEVKALEPLITRYIPVSYSNADSEVKPHIEQILSKGRGSVSVDAKNNQIIITDTAAVVKQAEDIVRRIDKVTAQVIIEARVVEVSDNFSRELGVDWSADYGPDAGATIDGFANTSGVAMNFPTSSSSGIGINFSRLAGTPFVLNAQLDAIETNGEGKILSSPKILTIDNKTAKIKQGLEYPYLERDSAGGSSVKYKNIDLLLEVTPHVTPDNRISLTIYITKNDVANVTDGVPSVSTNEAETELLVNDGDTVVIGGIIKETETKGENGFPLLKDIPILGWLFKNHTNSTQNNELLIFITPKIVQLEQAPIAAN